MSIEIVVEVGAKKTFASALAWPGWARSGPTEDDALEALAAYAPRYRAVLAGRVKGFPRTIDLEVVERLRGGSTTDFGAPGAAAKAEDAPPDAAELRRLTAILRACWQAFDEIAATHRHVTLKTGPRGGGRDLAKIRAHVLEGEQSYLSALGARATASGTIDAALAGVHDAFAEALGARARGEVADTGPRGGKRWGAPFAARRAAWHVLDHAWEIEDRADT